MFYCSFLLALFFTLAYFNILVIDICNSKKLNMQYDEEMIKSAQSAALMRWVCIAMMSILWPMVVIFF